MNRMHASTSARRRMAGLSLIEMMIAMVLSLIVAAGIISVFTSTSNSNKAQAQLANLQEAGRFAIYSLRSDLANANGIYCSNTGGNAKVSSSGIGLDSLRAPTIYAKSAFDFTDNTVTLAAATEAYSMPSALFMRGYDCDKTACTPLDPNDTVNAIPAMGKTAGSRVVGAAVLTFRYLDSEGGWALVPATDSSGSYMQTIGGVTTITLRPLTGEAAASDFNGGFAMLADCSNAQVMEVTQSGGVLTVLGTATTPGNYAPPMDLTKGSAPRVFDFLHDFKTVTYYLRVVDAGNGHTTGELVRRANGVDQALVRGVERLDFRYGIIGDDGNTRYLTANEVDTATDTDGDAIACPPGVPTPGGMGSGGCLWRAVQTIAVHVLMDGQTPLTNMTDAEINYIYTPDGDAEPEAPSAHSIQPDVDQGFPKQVLRREFTTLVSLRNFNP